MAKNVFIILVEIFFFKLKKKGFGFEKKVLCTLVCDRNQIRNLISEFQFIFTSIQGIVVIFQFFFLHSFSNIPDSRVLHLTNLKFLPMLEGELYVPLDQQHCPSCQHHNHHHDQELLYSQYLLHQLDSIQVLNFRFGFNSSCPNIMFLIENHFQKDTVIF